MLFYRRTASSNVCHPFFSRAPNRFPSIQDIWERWCHIENETISVLWMDSLLNCGHTSTVPASDSISVRTSFIIHRFLPYSISYKWFGYNVCRSLLPIRWLYPATDRPWRWNRNSIRITKSLIELWLLFTSSETPDLLTFHAYLVP